MEIRVKTITLPEARATKRQWFKFCFWLVEGVARVSLTSHRESEAKPVKSRITFDHRSKYCTENWLEELSRLVDYNCVSSTLVLDRWQSARRRRNLPKLSWPIMPVKEQGNIENGVRSAESAERDDSRKHLTCSLVGPSCEKKPHEKNFGCWRNITWNLQHIISCMNWQTRQENFFFLQWQCFLTINHKSAFEVYKYLIQAKNWSL